MTTTIQRESARIYAFPPGGRAGQKSRDGRSELERAVDELPGVDYGSWYHDEAIARDGHATDRVDSH